jgi:hypothetical protein
VILSLLAQVIARTHGLLPGLTAGLALAARVLPKAGGIGTRVVRGSESKSPAAPSWLTSLGDEAARSTTKIPRAEDRGVSPSRPIG